MKEPARFDFRDYLRPRVPIPDLRGGNDWTIFGAAVSELGLALVALHPGAYSPTQVDHYANIVFGPIDGDWPALASKIAQLPELLASTTPTIFLYADASCEGDQARALIAQLHGTFPNRVTLLPASDVQPWINMRARNIGVPNVPPADRWCIDLIARAAEAALYAEVELSLEREESVAIQSADISSMGRLLGSGRRITAAAYTKPYLSIVMLEEVNGQLILDDVHCATFIFDRRDAVSVQELSAKLSNVCREFSIERVLFRSAAAKGYYSATANCYKAEAILQMLPGIEIESVASQSVTLWLKNYFPALPSPQIGFDARWRLAQQRSIELAAFGLSPQHKSGRQS